MRCPKCGYTSFDCLENCKKCGVDFTEVKARFNLRSILFPGVFGVNAGSMEQPAVIEEPALSEAASGLSLLTEAADPEPEMVAEPLTFTEVADEPAEAGEEAPAFLIASSATQNPTTDPGSAVGELLAFMDGVDRPADSEDAPAADRALPPEIPPVSPPPPSFPTIPFPAAAAALAGAEVEVIEDEPIRISLEEFDRFEPGREEMSLFESSDSLPGLEGEFTAPVEWSVADPAPAGIASETPFEAAAADPSATDFAAVDVDSLCQAPAAVTRLAASAADLLILTAIFTLFLLAGELALHPAGAASDRPLTAILVNQAIPYFLVLFCLGFGYFTFFHFLLGQTVGKMLLRLRVETDTGEPVTFSRAFLRSTGGLLALLTAGIGFLPILRGGRGLSDRLAGTRVVKVR